MVQCWAVWAGLLLCAVVVAASPMAKATAIRRRVILAPRNPGSDDGVRLLTMVSFPRMLLRKVHLILARFQMSSSDEES